MNTITNETKDIQKLGASEVYQALGTEIGGLSQSEAQERMRKLGKNVLPIQKGSPMIWKFISNFTHLMAILLWVAGVIALIAKMPERRSRL